MKDIDAFWNDNIDPFNWRKISAKRVPTAWQKAVSTFWSPEMRHALSRMGPLGDKRILLLGSGLGQGTVPLARLNARVVGLDIAETRCRLAKQMLDREVGRHITFIVANAERLPFRTASFHVVLAQDVLMYSNPSRIFRECARVLMPHGKAVFVESMDGNPFLKLFRKVIYGRKMRTLTHPLKYEDLKELSDPGLYFENITGYYFLSVVSFAALYFFRSIPVYRWSLAVLYPVDRILLKMLPGLPKRSWKGVAVYGRHPESPVAEETRIAENSS